jgi:ribosomal protein L37AE/L43A
MTTEAELKAYKEGYKDGYNDAVKFYIVNPMINMHHNHYSCPVCGRTGVSSVVCSVPNCPTIAYATGAIGAAGSSYFNKTPVGGNGAAGV